MVFTYRSDSTISSQTSANLFYCYISYLHLFLKDIRGTLFPCHKYTVVIKNSSTRVTLLGYPCIVADTIKTENTNAFVIK